MRGFAMLLVVMCHVMLNCGLETSDTTLYAVICTFNMPLFFLISGFFAYKKLDAWTARMLASHLRLKISALIICTLVFYALLFYTRHQDIFGWVHKGFGAYWFTITLFEIFVTYYIVILMSRAARRDMTLPLMAGVSMAALLLLIKNPLAEQQWWQVAEGANYCLFLQYFTMGLIFKRYKERFLRVLTDSRTVGVLIVIYVVLLCFIYEAGVHDGILAKIYSVFALPYAGLWLTVSLFMVAANYFDRQNLISDGLCVTGECSLEIYMIHYFFLPTLVSLHNWLAPNSMILFQLLVSAGIAIPVIAICILFSSVIRKSGILSEFIFGIRAIKTH